MDFWTGFQKAIDDYVDGITLYDLIKNGDKLGSFADDGYCLEESEDDFYFHK